MVTATPTFTYTTTAVVSGTNVTFNTSVKASAATAVTNLAIGVRGPNGENLDLPSADGGASVTVPTGNWALQESETGAFTTPGTYSYGIVFQNKAGTWLGNLDGTHTFVIAGASTTTPPVTTPPVTTPPVTTPTTPDVTSAPTGDVTSNGKTWKLKQVEDFSRAATPSTFVSTYTNLGHITSGKYRNDLNVTVANGVLTSHQQHAGNYDTGSWLALLPGGTQNGDWAYTGSARISFRIKATGSSDYGAAAMLSVLDNANWGRDGEMDIWEGNNGTSANLNHHTPASGPVHQVALADTTACHTVTVEWIGGVSTTYYLDGVQVATYGASETASATAQFMAVIQTAAANNTDNGASDSATSDVSLDWWAAWQL